MKKKSIVIVIILLVITCIASFFYLRSRNDAPKGNLAIINGDKTVLIDAFSGSLVSVKGVTINAKGQEKDVDETGISLKDAISKSGLDNTGFTRARVVSSDEFAAEISFDEINEDGKAYLAKQQEDDGSTSARLYVFGDSDSKRQVKNVVRIELLNE
ncbi:hypothetical protein [Butyrivibrio sp. AC2005]|uniref:hypothetical protein n=1 Tax=Butyrivibrio sp. AC2005 TaxID=1280672 RepID=UPI000400E09B|nr:hypothetical protein [Butyrivibrio sp. AC2005]